jgi:hypothetical protein
MAAVMTTTSRTSYRDVAAFEPRTGPTTHLRLVGPIVAADRAPLRRRVSRTVYVRRRLSVVVLAIAGVLLTAQAGAALGGSSSEAPGRAPASTSFATEVVRPGDSLWSVSERLAPGEDPRPIVDALAEARHGAPLLPGRPSGGTASCPGGLGAGPGRRGCGRGECPRRYGGAMRAPTA